MRARVAMSYLEVILAMAIMKTVDDLSGLKNFDLRFKFPRPWRNVVRRSLVWMIAYGAMLSFILYLEYQRTPNPLETPSPLFGQVAWTIMPLALAQDASDPEMSRWTTGLGTGVVFFEGDEELNDSWIVEAKVGYDIDDSFTVEAGFGYLPTMDANSRTESDPDTDLASKYPSIRPAGPHPTIQQVLCVTSLFIEK